MENVVAAIFAVESEAYQALSELRNAPMGDGYSVAEAALLENEEGRIVMRDGFDSGEAVGNDMAMGIMVGAIAGILGGPLGVLLGASTGALAGGAMGAADAMDDSTLVEVVASKLYEDEVAIVALVQEEEPAFDAAFAKYETTVIRYDAAAVADEVDRSIELAAELRRQARAQLRSDRKAERQARREERSAAIKEHFDELAAKHDQLMIEMNDTAL